MLNSIGTRIFLAHVATCLKDCGRVCVTVSYECSDGSKEGSKRLRASANEIFSVYLRITMLFLKFILGYLLICILAILAVI